ncbi:farnesyl pyrophosphate synthase-like [Diabrotica virgifera virgifera]|uniref:Farnesyl pyrophosphate synthase-like n=1 Tax=Diabrotica virgifera virgifera TaxID=50390 RepID=A0ABM5L4P3_DIAVI|nr:farnesyl pyrophosphate synthase-like [Diabrotica virgifera virgifera]
MIKTIFQRDVTRSALKIMGRSNQKRRLATHPKRHPVFVRPTIDFTQEETILQNLIPQIREDILNESLVYQKNMPTVRGHVENLINDTVGDLKPKFLNCALIAIYAYKYFKQDHTEEELVKAGILGWCYKLQDLAMIIVDDILDESKIRYNKPPLYRVVGIKQAILDSIILESAANFLVLKYFSDHKHLVKIQKDLILNIATTTISQKQELSKYEIDELEVFENLIKSFPLLIHAVTSAVYLAGIDDPKIQSIVKKFCVDIAIFGKRYDDFTVFLDPKTIGEKDNTDIVSFKITWMAIQVSKMGSPQQKKTFMKHYGHSDPESVAIIFDIYRELNLVEHFDKYMMEFYDDMLTQIQNLPPQLPKEFFYNILDCAVANKMYA